MLRDLFMHQLSVPALNKWTTVSPCATTVAAMQHFCGIFPQVFRECFPAKPSGRCSSSGEDEGAELGQPIDQTKAWRRLARKRERKAALFLEDPFSAFKSLLWAVVTAPVMRIHFALFKRATWLSERVEEPNVEEDLGSTAAFVKAAVSPARKSIRLFASILADPSNECWLPLQGLYGGVSTWSQDKLRVTRRCILTLTGQMWRKLVEGWERYPWRLTELLQGSEDERLVAARNLFARSDCCLDGFTAKLLKQCGTAEQLVSEEVTSFLSAVLNRVVPTSTYVERIFSRFQRWSETKGHKLSLCQLAARHFTHTFKHIVENWRETEIKKGRLARARSQKHRPVWVSRNRLAVTGLHLFSKDFLSRVPAPQGRREEGKDRIARALRAWRVTPVNERQHWKRVAKAQNRQRRAAPAPASDLTGGLWSIASSQGFPLSRHILQQHLPRRKAFAQQFSSKTNSLQPENADSMDAWPRSSYNLFALCSSRACVSMLTGQQETAFQALLALMVHAIMTYAPLPKDATQEPMVLAFAAKCKQAKSSSCLCF